VIALFVTGASVAFGQYDVPFVPTDYAVVDSMLSAADVQTGERLYDLGCGDGRIVIRAAKSFGADAVGIDINPERIAESKANAEKEGVAGRVEFREQNLFEADFRDADVITMYLLSWVNLRLRPMFFRDLVPGTRLVSHAFTMGEWEPDRMIEVERQDGYGISHVFYWVVPANVSGDWTYDTGDNPHALHINQQFQKLTATITVRGNTRELPDIAIEGDRIRFASVVKRDDGTTTYSYDGRVSGDIITGIIHNSATGQTTQWEAKRTLNTMVVLDPMPAEGQN
jgi:SAM-dependent methyltransferase